MSEHIYEDSNMEHERYHVIPFGSMREEIVRCRDCMKWHHIDTLDGVRYGECDEWKRADSYCVPATRESGFCAWATCKCGEDIETNGRESVTCPSCGRVIRA